MDELKSKGKPFHISKQKVWEAYQKVKANAGAAGVDGQSIADFEEDLKNNLYRIWNRMSSGTYFPPPVLAVEIPKPQNGGTRVLGVPTVGDRIAQTVVASELNGRVEKIFHPDSYGYRVGRSALGAVATCRERCWHADWVIDLDIRSFFDTVPWDLIVDAVRVNTDQPWVLLYVKRWLSAPLQQRDGTVTVRESGTPQGSAVSPVLSNLFLHYAFDAFMAREFPALGFERYVDDAVIHCVSLDQAEMVLSRVRDRLGSLGLELHPDKTRIVYCKDGTRRLDFEHTEFTFLGFTFRARGALRRRDGHGFTSFLPAVSKQALTRMSAQVRSWRIHLRTGHTLAGLADRINPVVRGWMNYYGAFYRSALYPLLARINGYLLRFIRRKWKRRRAFTHAKAFWRRVTTKWPDLFAQWAWVRNAW